MSNDILIPETETDAPIELVGGKARGVYKLKSIEEKLTEKVYRGSVIVPQFFVIPNEMDLNQNEQEIKRAAAAFDVDKFAVRSSSPLEDEGEHSFDGIFHTSLNVPLEEIVNEVVNVRNSAMSIRAQEYADDVGVELDGRMPVIVQAMAKADAYTGVIYSKFPAARNIIKIIREPVYGKKKRKFIDAYLREDEDGKIGTSVDPLISSKRASSLYEFTHLINIGLGTEMEFGYPVIIEFALHLNQTSIENEFEYSVLQARKLTKLSEAEKFDMPELQEEGLLGSTYDVNGVGDVRGPALVTRMSGHALRPNGEDIRKFDREHPEGYILVTPFLEHYGINIEEDTPNKKAVVAYDEVGQHHDMELARKKGILYLNFTDVLGGRFHDLIDGSSSEKPVDTGDNMRAVSDGERGFIYNFSR